MKNTGFFHFSLADFGRARSRTGVFRTVFYSVFWRRASRPIKNRRFWPKNAPPPGKPVTFYECHPEDHAPAPSVRADFSQLMLVDLRIWRSRFCVIHRFWTLLSYCFGLIWKTGHFPSMHWPVRDGLRPIFTFFFGDAPRLAAILVWTTIVPGGLTHVRWWWSTVTAWRWESVDVCDPAGGLGTRTENP